jgi:hypothetical protein
MPPTPTLGSASSFDRSSGSRGGYFDFGFDAPPRSRGNISVGAAASSPYRPVSRDSSAGSQQGASSWSTTASASSAPSMSSAVAAAAAGSHSHSNPGGLSVASAAAKSRLPRTSNAGSNGARRPLSRLSMAPATAAGSSSLEKAESSTPTHAPATAASRSSAAVAAAHARSKRRQTSGIEGWRQ